MSRLFFGVREPSDEHILQTLYEYVDIGELRKSKTLRNILIEDILPLFPKILSEFSPDDRAYLIKTGVMDYAGNVRALGKGYLLSLIIQV